MRRTTSWATGSTRTTVRSSPSSPTWPRPTRATTTRTTPAAPTLGSTAEARVARLQAQLRAAPDNAVLLTSLADAYLVRARETADPTYYDKADQAVKRSRALAPDDVRTLTTGAFLDLARH